MGAVLAGREDLVAPRAWEGFCLCLDSKLGLAGIGVGWKEGWGAGSLAEEDWGDWSLGADCWGMGSLVGLDGWRAGSLGSDCWGDWNLGKDCC